MKPTFIAISAMLVLSSSAIAGDRATADVDCAATGEKLVYDCMIRLMNKDSGDPSPDAKIAAKAVDADGAQRGAGQRPWPWRSPAATTPA